MKKLFLIIYLMSCSIFVFPTTSNKDTQSPVFSAQAVFPNGTIGDLSLDDEQFKNKKIVLYFYPWDDTPHCKKQAKIFRDHIEELKKHNIVVIGANNGSLSSHKKFIEKHNLPFPIIYDKNKKVAKLFNVSGFMSRKTVLIDENHNIIKVFKKVKINQQIPDIIKAFDLI